MVLPLELSPEPVLEPVLLPESVPDPLVEPDVSVRLLCFFVVEDVDDEPLRSSCELELLLDDIPLSLELPVPLEDGLCVVEGEDEVPLDPVFELESEVPAPLLVDELPLPPMAPAEVTSRFFTCIVSPDPERLARTWSPSLMSSMDARVPSFVTCVLESSLSGLSAPESVIWFFERSKLWTLPWSVPKWPLAVELESVEAVAPDGVLLEPVPMDELPVPIDDEPVEVEPLTPELLAPDGAEPLVSRSLLVPVPSEPELESRVVPLDDVP